MLVDLTRYWYRPSLHWLTVLLLPFSWLFGCCAALRRGLYRYGFLKVQRALVPVIVVGNITVGGTGKTPFVIWLAKFLRQQNYKPGIVSRGVGGLKHNKPHLVTLDNKAAQVGDEALLLAKHGDCPVVICTNRPAAVAYLLKHTDCNVVINDDGLQHYRLARDIEIALVDGERRFGNQQLLPAGPLREPVTRLNRVDFVVVNGGNEQDNFRIAFTANNLVSLTNPEDKKSLQTFSQQTVHAVAGIGHPERFFNSLKLAGLNVIPHVFPDHYHFNANDIIFADNLPVIMTEKDAVKCRDFVNEKCWYLAINAEIDANLQQAILAKLKNIS